MIKSRKTDQKLNANEQSYSGRMAYAPLYAYN